MPTTDTPRALVTGAASGLGLALTEQLSAQGYRVLATDLADERPPLPAGVDYLHLDVCSEDDWAAAREWVRTSWSGLDLLVNNAGIPVGGRFDHTSLEQWDRAIDVNLLGVVRGCAAFVPLFKEQGSGRIINTASLAGLVHPPAMGPYTATKAAVVALSETLHWELEPYGVAVSALCPGFFRSNIAAAMTGEDPVVGAMAADLVNNSPRDAHDIAARVIAELPRNRPAILPDRDALIAVWTKRLAPWLYRRQMQAMARRAMGAPRQRQAAAT